MNAVSEQMVEMIYPDDADEKQSIAAAIAERITSAVYE